MPDFDLDQALARPDWITCHRCKAAMDLHGLEHDEYFGTVEAVFQCPQCAEHYAPATENAPLVLERVDVPPGAGPMGLGHLELIQCGRCPSCQSTEALVHVSCELDGEQVRAVQSCDDCRATWTEVYSFDSTGGPHA